jgi:phosphinothricin acetyltransferase
MSGPFIRQAEIKDVDAINSIYNQAIDLGTATADTRPVERSEHLKWLERHLEEGNPVLVAEVDGRVAGWISLDFYRYGRPALRHVRETSYYIDGEYRGKGIAAALMKAVIDLAPETGVEVLITFIIEGNIRSISLMNKFSFELWGKLPGIVNFTHGLYDHLIYGKKLKA